MPALIDSLRRDHADMELLLKVLEQEIAVFDRSNRPDFDIIEGVVDYFRCYPAQCHHPKEDLLFAKLRRAILRAPRGSLTSRPSTARPPGGLSVLPGSLMTSSTTSRSPAASSTQPSGSSLSTNGAICAERA